MSLEWIIIVGIAIAMYIILYKYERRMEQMQKLIDKNKNKIHENKSKIDENHKRIQANHGRLDEHYNHIEKIWVSSPTHKKNSSDDDQAN